MSNSHDNVCEFRRMHEFLLQLEEAADVICVDSLPSPEFTWEGKKVVSFSSNNYLSLANDPRVVAAAKLGLEKYGVGNCESRLLGGDLEIYRELEARLAQAKRKEDAILFATGYLTNLGALSSFARSSQVLRLYGYRASKHHRLTFFTDEYNHLSIREGIRASDADKRMYPHGDLNRLEALLKKTEASMKIIVTDGVFSQDGDIAPLPGLLELADRYDALLYVDDAHGTGVLGESGGGISEHFHLFHPRMIHMGTLSKAYGAIGGFLAADRAITNVLRYTCSAYGFTSTLPPDQVFAIDAVMDIIRNEPQRRRRLWHNQRYFCTKIKALGFELISEQTPILPILIGDEVLTNRFSVGLREAGFHVDTAKFPAVAIGKARLRVIVNANHTVAQMDALADALVALKHKLWPARSVATNPALSVA